MPELVDYENPRTPQPRPWRMVIREIYRKNTITVWCSAVIIGCNVLAAIPALLDPDRKGLVYSMCLTYVLAPVSLLLTPWVWSRSDEYYEQDGSRYLAVLVHVIVSIALPTLCPLVLRWLLFLF